MTDTVRCKTHKIRTIRLWAVHMLPLPCSLTEHPPVDQWTQKSQAGNSARSYVFLPLSPGTSLRTRKPGIIPPPYRHLSLSLSLLQGAVRELHPVHRGRWESAWCVCESQTETVFSPRAWHSCRFNRDKEPVFSIHSVTRWSKISSWYL